MNKVIIIGGGIAGLVSSIHLAKQGISSLVMERKVYPFHRVCGEYVSNEAIPYLKSLEIFPHEFRPPSITRFQLSSISGKATTLPLDLGGFGISRYNFDNFLMQRAVAAGVTVLTGVTAEDIAFSGNNFQVKTDHGDFQAEFVLAAHGKRSNIDLHMQRNFTRIRSPYVGVKYHVRHSHPRDVVALHNFDGGYCGISPVENNIVNVCYLVHRDRLKQHKNISTLENVVLRQNPHLNELFTSATFLYEKPETINEISFETKLPVEHHMLMIGDAAGMITPLCGNGMAMAIHSAKLAAESVTSFYAERLRDRQQVENAYAASWSNEFRMRLWAGRKIQGLFGSRTASSLAMNLAMHFDAVTRFLMRKTHGKPF